VLHPLIDGPRSLEIARSCISRCHARPFELFPIDLPALSTSILHIGFEVNFSYVIREDKSGVVTGVQSLPKIFKVMELLVKLGRVDVNLLDHSVKVVLLSYHLISGLKTSQLLGLSLKL
jgi:hypothetical protein